MSVANGSRSFEFQQRSFVSIAKTPYVIAKESELRRSMDRVIDPDFAITRDRDFWDKVEGNATIRAARDFRRHLVAGPRVAVEAKTPLQKPLVPYAEALLGRIKGFATARLGLADAFARGLVVGRLHGHWEDVDLVDEADAVGKQRWYFLDAIKIQPKGRWEIKRWQDPETGRWRWGWAVYDFGALTGGDEPPGWRLPRFPDWYVHHRYAGQEDALYGRDLGRALYWLAHAEHVLWESTLDTAERFGSPWIRGRLKEEVGGLSPGSGGDVDAFATAASKVLEVIKKLRAHNVLVGDDRLLDVDLLEAGLRGADFTTGAIDRIQLMARVLLLGSNLPTSATTGGSFSLAQVQDESTRRLVRYDRELLGETLTDQVLERLLRWNRPALSRIPHPDRPTLTLADVGTPAVRILDDEVDDPTKRAFQLSFAQQVPLPIRDEDLYALGGFTPPAEGEKATTIARAAGNTVALGAFVEPHSPAWRAYADGRLA